MASGDLESRGRGKNMGNGYSSSSYSIEVDPESRWNSWLVPMFVVANVAVFIAVMCVNNCPKNNSGCVARFLGRFSFEPLRENPLFGPSSSTLQKMGGLDQTKVVHQHQGWRLVTCIWLHAGVIHLLANMLSLIFIGIRLEQQFGFVRIGIIYLLSGFGGSLLSSLFIQNNISVGASGALFGLLGAMLSELFTNWTIYSNKLEFFPMWTILPISGDLLQGSYLGSYCFHALSLLGSSDITFLRMSVSNPNTKSTNMSFGWPALLC